MKELPHWMSLNDWPWEMIYIFENIPQNSRIRDTKYWFRVTPPDVNENIRPTKIEYHYVPNVWTTLLIACYVGYSVVQLFRLLPHAWSLYVSLHKLFSQIISWFASTIHNNLNESVTKIHISPNILNNVMLRSICIFGSTLFVLIFWEMTLIYVVLLYSLILLNIFLIYLSVIQIYAEFKTATISLYRNKNIIGNRTVYRHL